MWANVVNQLRIKTHYGNPFRVRHEACHAIRLCRAWLGENRAELCPMPFEGTCPELTLWPRRPSASRWLSVKDAKRLGPRPLSGRGFEHDTAWARYKGFGEKSLSEPYLGLPDRAGLILRRKNVGKIAGFRGSSCPRFTDGTNWLAERVGFEPTVRLAGR
jgi:hypothetical protein